MNTEIINIGDELLIGQVINTNCAYMAKILNQNGITVKYITVINDDSTAIKNAVTLALQRTDCVLITGGLGPTKDDITKHCLNEMFNGKLIENKEVSTHVKSFFERRNLPYTDTNRSQSFIPDCCQIIFNPVGTTPGMIFNSNGKLVISMPGVPFEMERMMDSVIPILLKHYETETIIHKSVLVSGIGESFLSDKLEEFELNIKNINNKDKSSRFSLAYLPNAGVIKLRLSMKCSKRESALEKFQIQYSALKTAVGDFLIGEDDKSFAQIIGEKLQSKNQTLITVESCTGGNIAHSITLNPGASVYFKGGIVAYCNEIKNKTVRVEEDTLSIKGAVSEETARQMAENAVKLYNTDFAISTTGLAGPDSDGTDTEIGTVYIGLAKRNGETIVEKSCFKTSRSNFIDRVTNAALFLLWKNI